MKKLRCICFITALVLLIGTFAMSGCSKDEKEETPAKETVKINLAEYTMIRGQNAGKTEVDAAVKLRSEFVNMGLRIDLKDDWDKEVEGSKEILIGNTSRKASADLSKILKEKNIEGFAISVSDSKITLCATKISLLLDATEYFFDNIVKGNTEIEVEKDYLYISDDYPVITLVENSKCDYTVVRADAANKYMTELVKSIRDTLKQNTGIPTLSFVTDRVQSSENAKEILIGNTNRPESKKALENLGYDEYCILYVNDKIVINGWSTKAIEVAVARFNRIIVDNIKEDKSVKIPLAEKWTGKIDSCIENVPEPEGAELLCAYQGLGDTYECIYKDASEKMYKDFVKKLADEGYKQYDSREVAKNLFSTYTKGKTGIYVSYLDYNNTLTVVSETYGHLPGITEEKYERVTESKVAQISLDGKAGNFGMCYVVTLADGRYIVVDGGGNASNDEEVLYNYLKDNNKRKDGKIDIALWIFTHEHYDHVTNFLDFSARYGKFVTLENVAWNFIPAYEDGAAGVFYTRMLTAIRSYKDTKIIKVHTGQRMYISNAEIDILLTNENVAPENIDGLNNSCTVFTVTLDGEKIMFTGDIEERYVMPTMLCSMYGKLLKSDILQMAHHGLWGGSIDLYRFISPEIAFLPVQYHANDYPNAMSAPTTKYIYELKEKGIVKDIIVAAERGTVTVTLPLKK